VFLPLIEGSMDMESNLEQRPFGNAEFAENPENRCPVLLLLDTSGSMQGPPITELNEGLQLFRDELFADSLAAKRVEVSIVSFGPVKVQADFTGIQYFQAPTLAASGGVGCGLLKLKKGRRRAAHRFAAGRQVGPSGPVGYGTWPALFLSKKE
jgi:hypothetical protein